MAKATPKSQQDPGELREMSPNPPEMHGGDVAAAEYRRVYPDLKAIGHASGIFLQSLVSYCEAFALAQIALAEIHDIGITIQSEGGGRYANPAHTTWAMAKSTMEKEAKNLGMTPASLKSIRAAKKKPNGDKTKSPSQFLSRN